MYWVGNKTVELELDDCLFAKNPNKGLIGDSEDEDDDEFDEEEDDEDTTASSKSSS